MQVHRRHVLLGTPTAAAGLAALESDLTPSIHVDPDALAARLSVGRPAIEGALSRLERFLPRPGALFTADEASLGAFRLEAPGIERSGRWTFEDPTAPGPSLAAAVAVGCRGAGSGGERGVRLRWVGGCAFGGVTVLVYKARRATLGLIVPGHHYGRPPRTLVLGA